MSKKISETSRLANSKTKLLTVKLSQLNVDREMDFCHREKGYDSDESVSQLADSIVTESLQTPLIVAIIGTDANGVVQYRIIAGHRRIAAIWLIIKRHLDRINFHPDMEIQVVLVEPEDYQDESEFDRELMIKSIADNAVRRDFTKDEQLDIVRKCRRMEIPDPRAAMALGLSEQQYSRLAAVVETPWLLDLVKQSCIGMSDAASLIKAADNESQKSLLRHGLNTWVKEKEVVLLQERNNASKMGRTLTGSADRIKKYLTPALIKHWITCIRDAKAFNANPVIDFGVLVDSKAGTLEIPKLSIDIRRNSRELFVKVIGELIKGAESSAELLRQKEHLDGTLEMSKEERLRLLEKTRSEYEQKENAKEEARKGREPQDNFADSTPGDLDAFDLEDETPIDSQTDGTES